MRVRTLPVARFSWRARGGTRTAKGGESDDASDQRSFSTRTDGSSHVGFLSPRTCAISSSTSLSGRTMAATSSPHAACRTLRTSSAASSLLTTTKNVRREAQCVLTQTEVSAADAGIRRSDARKMSSRRAESSESSSAPHGAATLPFESVVAADTADEERS